MPKLDPKRIYTIREVLYIERALKLRTTTSGVPKIRHNGAYLKQGIPGSDIIEYLKQNKPNLISRNNKVSVSLPLKQPKNHTLLDEIILKILKPKIRPPYSLIQRIHAHVICSIKDEEPVEYSIDGNEHLCLAETPGNLEIITQCIDIAQGHQPAKAKAYPSQRIRSPGRLARNKRKRS